MRGRYERRPWQWNPALYAPPRYQRACEYQVFIPDPLADFELDIQGTVAGAVSDAEAAIGWLNRTARRELMPLARLLLRTESIASSKVEGLQLDTRALARAEARQESGRSIGRDAVEILANIDAMQLAIEQAAHAGAITTDLLLDVHRRLLEHDARQRSVGRLRDQQNWIGGNDYNPCGAAFVPPPREYVEPLMVDLCAFCSEQRLPPLVQAAIAHAQFETIHPFEDGNGRTGRALVQVILRRRDLAPTYVPPISVILARDKDMYIRGLSAFRDGHINDWLEMFASAAAQAATLARRYLDEVEGLKLRWVERVRSIAAPRKDAAVWALIDVLPAHPIISIAVAAAATGRTRPAVSNAIAELHAAGVLQRLGDSERNRSWEADGLLDVISRLEAGELTKDQRPS